MIVRIKAMKAGSLGGKGFFKKSAMARRRVEARLARRIGEKKVQGKLAAITTWNKSRNPKLAKMAAADRRYIAHKFVGKRIRR